MANFGWLFPTIDVGAETVQVPLGPAAVFVALFLLLLFLAIFRAGWQEVLGSTARVGLVLVGVLGALALLARVAEPDHGNERRPFDQRLTELNGRAMASGSPLGCLDPYLAEALEAACEKAVFATPEAVAAATTYVAASVSLLIDGLANGVDPNRDRIFAELRRRIERDRFGMVARLLGDQEGCTAAHCEKLGLLADASYVKVNLQQRTYEALLSRYAAGWSQRAPLAAAATPVPAATSPASSGTGINYPSAASIPAISIMSKEPTEPATQAASPQRQAPSKRAPLASHPSSPAQQAPAPPVQLAPPAANADTRAPQ